MTITAHVDEDTLAAIDRIADERHHTREAVIAEVVADYVRDEAGYETMLQAAEDEIDRGEFYTHEQMIAWAASLPQLSKK